MGVALKCSIVFLERIGLVIAEDVTKSRKEASQLSASPEARVFHRPLSTEEQGSRERIKWHRKHIESGQEVS